MAETGVLDQTDNDVAVAPLPAAPATESAPVNPFEPVGALDAVTPETSNVIPIDTSAQVTSPATTTDAELPTYDATTSELTDKQLVSGNIADVLQEGGVLMDVARSAGDEYSQSRGMLGSSMGAEASMRAMIDTALPIAQQDASAQLSQLQQNQAYENQAAQFNATNEVQQTRDSILQSYQLQMENLSTNNKSQLIDLEQKYAAAIQSDQNASSVYSSTMESISEVMSNGSLSIDQQTAGVNELIGMLDAYLDFNANLNSVNSVTGAGSTEDRSVLLDQQRKDEEVIRLERIAEYDQRMNELLARKELMPRKPSQPWGDWDAYEAQVARVAAWNDEVKSLNAEYQRYTR